MHIEAARRPRFCTARVESLVFLLAVCIGWPAARAQSSKTSGVASPSLPASVRKTAATTHSDGRRFPADSFWSRRWISGGNDQPDRFVEPRHIVVAGSTVAVLDLGTREVIVLNARTGALLKTMVAQGEGPGEFKRPSMLATLGANFGVLDQATSRLSMFAPSGALAWDTPLADAVMLEGICTMPDASVVIKTPGAERSLRSVDSTGRIRWQRSLPTARAGDDSPPFASLGFLSAAVSGGRCALAPQFGASWYAFDARGNVQTFAYIEAGAPPVLKSTTTVLDKSNREELRQVVTTSATPAIARGVLARGDTIIVMAGATKRSPYQLLDYYAMPSGRYQYSRKLFASPTALAMAADGTLYGTFIASENSSVIAFTPTKVAPPPPPKRADSSAARVGGTKPPPR